MGFDKGPCANSFQERNELLETWVEKNKAANMADIEANIALALATSICIHQQLQGACQLAMLEASQKQLLAAQAAWEAEMAYSAYIEKEQAFIDCVNNHKNYYH